MKKILSFLCGIITSSLMMTSCVGSTQETFDLVITGGRVIDPETGLDANRNIGINDGRIETITTHQLVGKQQLNAAGLVVSPGFIDLHDHDQNLVGQTYHVYDGVTTALELEIGVYPYPNKEQEAQPLSKQLKQRIGNSLIHYGYSAGHYGARFRAKGDLKKAQHEISSSGELQEILTYIEQDLDQGALGIGLALDYVSLGVSDTELKSLFRLAAHRNVPLFVHMRMADNPTAPDGLEEMIELARSTDASFHAVHLTFNAREKLPYYLNLIEEARAEGIDVTAETFVHTETLWNLSAGVFQHNWQNKFGITYQDILFVKTGEYFSGKKMWDQYRQKYPNELISVNNHTKEEWIIDALRNTEIIIAADGYEGTPRGAGTFTRVLGRYVRDKKILSYRKRYAK